MIYIYNYIYIYLYEIPMVYCTNVPSLGHHVTVCYACRGQPGVARRTAIWWTSGTVPTWLWASTSRYWDRLGEDDFPLMAYFQGPCEFAGGHIYIYNTHICIYIYITHTKYIYILCIYWLKTSKSVVFCQGAWSVLHVFFCAVLSPFGLGRPISPSQINLSVR